MNSDTYAMCIHPITRKGSSCSGATCTVTYLPREPEIYCLGPADQRLLLHNRSTIVGAAIIALILAGAFGWVEFSARRELRLASV